MVVKGFCCSSRCVEGEWMGCSIGLVRVSVKRCVLWRCVVVKN